MVTPRRGDHIVPRVQRPQTADDVAGFAPLLIERAQILTDGAAVVEPQAGVDRQRRPDRDGVAHEPGRGDEHAAGDGGIARDGLKRPAAVVDEPDTGRNDRGQVMLALFELPADPPLVIGAQEPRPVVIDGPLGGRANERESAERLRRAAEDAGRAVEPAWRRHAACARVVFAIEYKPADDAHPRRCWMTTCASGGRTSWPGPMRAGAGSLRTASRALGARG